MEALFLQPKSLWSASEIDSSALWCYFMYKPSSDNQILNEGILLSQHGLLLLKIHMLIPG